MEIKVIIFQINFFLVINLILVAQTLNYFGAKISGFGRRDFLPDNDEYKVYREYFVRNNLPVLLNNCDYVVNVLPSSNETRGLLNGDMLKNCSSMFYPIKIFL